MRSFDLSHVQQVLDKLQVSGRKRSNPSFQSTSTEDIQNKTLVNRVVDSDIRKSRNPFGLDMLTDSHPKDVLRCLLQYFKQNSIKTTQKVEDKLTQAAYTISVNSGPSTVYSVEIVEVSSIIGVYTFEIEAIEKSKAVQTVQTARRRVESAIEYCLLNVPRLAQ